MNSWVTQVRVGLCVKQELTELFSSRIMGGRDGIAAQCP